MSRTTLATAIRNKNNEHTTAIVKTMYNNAAWGRDIPPRIYELRRTLRRGETYHGWNQIRAIISDYFAPYLEHFPETYNRVDDVIAQLPRIITRIKAIQQEVHQRRQELARLEAEKATLEARIKQLKEDDEMFKAAKAKPHSMDEESLNLDRHRYERHYISDWMPPVVPVPEAPPAPIDPKDIAEVSIEGAQFIDDMQDGIPNLSGRTDNTVNWDRIMDLMEALNRTPFGTRIHINDFTDAELHELGPYLMEWFDRVIAPRCMSDDMLIAYEIDGERRVLHRVHKDLYRIREMFTTNQFFKIDKAYDSLNAYDETIYLNMFDRIYFLDFSKATNRPYKYRAVHGDGFFPRKLSGNYKLLEPYFERYQVYARYTDSNNKTKKTVNVPCFTYALQMAGIPTETTDKILAFMGFQKRINRKQWTDICNEFNLRIHLRIVNEKGEIDIANQSNKGWYGPENGQEVHLAEYLNHMFIDEPLPITGFALRNWNTIYNLHKDVDHLVKTYKLKKGKPSIDNKRANIRSLDAIVAIDRVGGFESINATDEDVVTANVFGYEIQEPEPIAAPYSEKAHTRNIEPDKRNNKEVDAKYPIFYADFETCKRPVTDDKNRNGQAIPFMLCITSQSGKWERTYTGFDCMDQLMNEITEKVKSYAVIYFHNLGFDGNFLMKYADKQMIKKGNKIMRIPLSYNGKIIELRDSYSLFPKKLASFPSSFPEAFKGTEIQKEFFPYDYYTYERIEKCLE